MALVHRDSGRADEAIRLLREALGVAQAKLGAENAQTLSIRRDLALTHLAAGYPGEAVPILEDLVKLGRAKKGSEDIDTLANTNNLVRAYLDAGRWSEAEAQARECLEVRARKQPDNWLRFHTMSQLGAALAGQKKYAEAEPLLIGGYEGLEARQAKIPVPSRKTLPAAAARIVPFYEAWGKMDKAAEWRRKLGSPEAPKPGP
jgi:tetratricopeptide (TPR) repeat protein